jgi:hypothetical protein
MHLFDPATGENLTVDRSAMGTSPVLSEPEGASA